MVMIMLAVAALAAFGRPVHKLSAQRPRVQIEQLIPRSFGDWREFSAGRMVMPDPQTMENLAKIYTQTLSRSYVSSKGTIIMLSIAYGEDQRKAMAVHYPEICYPAQGFQIRSNHLDSVETTHGVLPVRRLETSMSAQRFEPVTYWVTIGDRISLGGFERRLIELEFGFQRIIPDGLLFRVSSINKDSSEAFRDQDRFIQDLVASLPPSTRSWMAGDPAKAKYPALN
jgi:EpsI family protein